MDFLIDKPRRGARDHCRDRGVNKDGCLATTTRIISENVGTLKSGQSGFEDR
jgi:hypothetical protein